MRTLVLVATLALALGGIAALPTALAEPDPLDPPACIPEQPCCWPLGVCVSPDPCRAPDGRYWC